MSDSEAVYDSEQDVSQSHSKLIEAVSQLDKVQRVKRPERSEPTLEVSEFHLVKSGLSDRDPVQLHELAKTLKRKGHHTEIVKKFRSAQKKAKVLPKPLEKPAAERIKRLVGFQNTKKELGKWNAVITKNRVAESLSFPLSQSSMKLETSNEFLKRFSLQSDLAKELAALEPPKEPEKPKNKYSLTLEEIIERRKEAAKFRAQQSYREAKANRQRKIKSKKFHRVQRKERIKQQMKEFEELQKTNPEAALEKLEQLDKTRAEERMSLRHKSTGQWAKSKLVRAKYDKDTRQVLAQQLSIGRELTQKMQKGEDSEAEAEENEAPMTVPNGSSENPWVMGIKTEKEINDFISSYRKYWDEKSKKGNVETTGQEEKKDNIKSSQNGESCSEMHNEIINGHSEQHMEYTLNDNSEKEKLMAEELYQDDDIDSEGSQTEDDENPTQKVLNKKTGDKISREKEATYNGSALKPVRNKPIMNSRKGMKQKIRNKVYATSEWSVQSLAVSEDKEGTAKRNKVRDINEMFDSMEDKVQDKLKAKLNDIKHKYDTGVKKRKHETKNNDYEEDVFEGLEFTDKKNKPVLNEPMNETMNNQYSKEIKDAADLKTSSDIRKDDSSNNTSSKAGKEAEIDPNKYINVKPVHLKTQFPDLVTGGDEGLDDSEDEEAKFNIISEAFADDDVVDEFRKEKEEEVKKSQPEDLDLSMPGWGSWGGKCVSQSKRKKRRFIVKFPERAQRKDENKGNVIIIEEKDPKIRQHQVSELPFPFTSVKDFEASIRAPIGRNFVPENIHKKLIEPTVKTKLGSIIEPMTEEVLVDKKKLKPGKQLGKKRNKPSKVKQRKGV